MNLIRRLCLWMGISAGVNGKRLGGWSCGDVGGIKTGVGIRVGNVNVLEHQAIWEGGEKGKR